ncbi:hypothetical protein FUAX_19700 [Fulvitalea axinellae]|uniref:Secretory lipase n=1 Tax=Fulvitalea axinellae TaxID=1182444 RepID=A0AAU9CHL8_9BACT|nr:hypothetical protein FUAX_19700 [Fulvitalea axinellae]
MIKILHRLLAPSYTQDTSLSNSLSGDIGHRATIKARYSRTGLKLLLNLSSMRRLKKFVGNGIRIYRLEYPTTYKGHKVTASGLVCIPEKQTPSAIICALRSTILAHKLAPSEVRPFYGLELYAAAGYITFIPDMLGFGSSKHLISPYHNHEHAASTVIDMIKAGLGFLNSQQFHFKKDLYIMGYSEGGYSALATQRALEHRPIQGLKLKAVAAGAGAYNIPETMSLIFDKHGHSNPSLIAYMLYAYKHMYEWNHSFEQIFKAPYSNLVHKAFNGQRSIDQANELLHTRFDRLFHNDFLTLLKNPKLADFSHSFVQNSLHDWLPLTPVKLYHSKADQTIPYTDSVSTYETMKLNGARNLSLNFTKPLTHGEAVFDMAEETFAWFGAIDNAM